MSGESYPFSLRPVPTARIETAYRTIRTPLPTPGAVAAAEQLVRNEPRSMAIEQLPVLWDRAEGFQVFDEAGNRWIDFTSGIFVANAGHGHPRIVAAIRSMLDRPLLHNYYFPSEIRARLTSKLIEMTRPNLDCVFLLTTGAESTEAAMKMARMRGSQSTPRKLGIVSLTFAFHGKTLGAQQAGGRSGSKWWIGQLDPNFHLLPVPFAPVCPYGPHESGTCSAECFHRGMADLESAGVDLEGIAAFIFEPYQGWSAAFLPDDYVAAMRSWADQHGALLISDEVQAGFGRTGRLFGYEHFGVDVDLVCCGKGFSSSVPISAVLGPRGLIDVDGSLNSTHGGNPISCAAALANLEVIEDEGLIDRAQTLGTALETRLRAIQARFPERIAVLSGRGAVWGLLLRHPRTGEWDAEMSDEVTEVAMRKGLLMVRTGVGSIKLGPPLTIPLEAALEGIDALEESFAECFARAESLV